MSHGAGDLQALDAAHHLHPFTDHRALRREGSRILTRGEGVWLWDADGNRLLDGMAGLWCVNLGYGREELVEAAARQLRELPYYNSFFQCTHPRAVELAAELAAVSPEGLSQVMFTGSGSEATDTVVRTVRHYWRLRGEPQRRIIISRRNAYHGSTVAAATLGGMKPMHEQGGPGIPDVEHIEQPYWFGLGGNLAPDDFGLRAARWLESRIEALGPENVAAFIAEPVQGAGGVVVPPASYWPEIARICEQFGILLVADEVICGFGRTGHWFGSQHYRLRPDLISIAKGLSSGYLPIGGVMVGDHVAATLVERGGEYHHGFTYAGHPACAAVALETIRIMREERIVERVRNDVAPAFRTALASLEDHPLVGEVRCLGLMAAIQLCADRERRTPFAEEGRVATACREHAFDAGLIMRAVGDSMILAPALVIGAGEIEELAGRARIALDRTLAELAALTSPAR